MRQVADSSALVKILRAAGDVLFAPAPEPGDEDRPIPVSPSKQDVNAFVLMVCIPKVAPTWGRDDGSGLTGALSDLEVSANLYRQLGEEIKDETSELRRHSSRPIVRAFVYVDISDFSKMPDGVQLLVVLALVRIADKTEQKIGKCEAALCIGDGYIYVWDEAVGATRFAANLAREIERSVADGEAPEFHVRIGVHVGEVRWFWDPGRKDWNYTGTGINGGNRVLSAIGKDTDDVVFISGDVRSAIQKVAPSSTLLPAMHNRGRKADKHGNLWRVYELNHSAQPGF